MTAAQPHPCPPAGDPVVEIAKAAGDDRRAHLLRLLAHDSFAVSELAHVFSAAQPAISHHLKVLRNAGLVQQRREGNSIYYRRCDAAGSPFIRELFRALDARPAPVDLRRRVAGVHRDRERTVRAFFESNADALKSQQKLISESSVYADSLRDIWHGHLRQHTQALEVGPGDAQILRLLARDFAAVTAIDSSRSMLDPVRAEALDVNNLTLVQAEFAKYDGCPADLIVAAMVLHHQTSPRAFFEIATGHLNPGGLLLIAELDRHQHDWVTEACGDLWLGFTPQEMDGWAASVGLEPATRQFLAQRNGFSIQLVAYTQPQTN
jgi:ArsR family transcriptional regulator